MAQYGNVIPDVIKRLTLSPYRKPTFSCFISTEGDVSQYLKDFDVDLSVEDSLKDPNYGSGTIVLANKDGMFSARGMPSIEPNSWVKLFAGFDDQNIPIWSGIVTDPQINAEQSEITLQVAQPGIILRRADKEYGDVKPYNTPKLLIDYLCKEAGLATPVIENSTGVPTSTTFGNTYMEETRDYWKLIHGACLCIFYVPYFDENGTLNCKRRSSYNESGFCYTDDIIKSIYYLDSAALINKKTIDFITTIKFEFQFSDKMRPYQHSITKSDMDSISLYGTFGDVVTDPLIGIFSLSKAMCFEILDFYNRRRVMYSVNVPGVPYLQLFDMVTVESSKADVHGRFIIIGRKHTGTHGRYTTIDTLLSAPDKF